jgi:hypothetical protein
MKFLKLAMMLAVFEDWVKAKIPVIRMTTMMMMPRYRLDLSLLSYCSPKPMKHKIAPAQRR